MPSGLPEGGAQKIVAVAPVEEMVLSQMSVGSSTVTEGVLNLSGKKSHESIGSSSSADGNPATKKRPAAASTKKRPAGANLPEAGDVLKKPAVAASAAGQEVATDLKGPAGAIAPAEAVAASAAGQEVATELKGLLQCCLGLFANTPPT